MTSKRRKFRESLKARVALAAVRGDKTMCRGFLYLAAVMDWYSRYVLSWRLSNTIDGGCCLEALDEALCHGRPGYSTAIRVANSRPWRSVKYEEVYLKDYSTAWEAKDSLTSYFHFYCDERIHQSLGYRTPGEVYRAS